MLVGGVGPNADFIDAVYGKLPAVLALITFITFVLLVRAFRSVLLPLKAVVLNVVSIAAAFGRARRRLAAGLRVRGDVGHRGHRRDHRRGCPLMVFAFLFGLSMDYEVFILARMREEYDATGSTHTGGGPRASAGPDGW